MEKSMYSLILIDEVIEKIDSLAHKKGVSRSALINQILAEHVSLMTPERRIALVFEALKAEVAQGEILPIQTSTWMIQMRSVLRYRYHPTLRYSVEFSIEDGHYHCELRVGSRTQSDALLSRLTVFFELWSQIELSQRSESLPGGVRFSINAGRFKRILQVEKNGEICGDAQALGRAIGSYLLAFDQALKLSFAAEHGVDLQTFDQMETLCREQLASSALLL